MVTLQTTKDQGVEARISAVGDFVIGFGTGTPGADWASSAKGPGWEAWRQPPGLNWKGFPVQELEAPGWRIWKLGNFSRLGCPAAEKNRVLVEVAQGKRPARELNGHLLLWAWEADRRLWHVWTDRFGSLHAYYGRSGDSAALGTSFQAVADLASRRQLDWPALTGFFGFGFFPGDRTYYDDVRILRPATHYVFGAKGEEIKAQKYWDWRHEPDRKRSYEDTVAEFGERFQAVMADMLGTIGPQDYGTTGPRTSEVNSQSSVVSSPVSRIAVPISGGLDSRCTVAAVDAEESRKQKAESRNPESIWSYSYGYSDDSVETRIARQVAAARGLPFDAFTIKPYLFEHLEHIVNAVEGFQDVTQCRQAFVAGELAKHADYVIAAHWGDVWLDDTGIGKAESRKQKAEIEQHALAKMLKKGRGWLLEHVCAPHLGGEAPESLLRGFVDKGMAPLQHIEDLDFRVKAFKTDNWSFRWTLASLRMFQAAAFPRLPFYDTRLADFFCTVPSEFVTGRRLQIDYLKRFAPDLARIKWQARDADLFSAGRSPLWSLPKRALGKAGRAISGKQVLQRNWEVQFGGKEGRANLDHWLTRPGLKLHEYVSPPNTQKLVNDFYNRWPDPALGYSVSMLLTFSAWLESHP